MYTPVSVADNEGSIIHATAHVTQEEPWWVINIPQPDGGFGQTASRGAVERAVREIAGLVLNVPDEEIVVQRAISH